MISKMPLVLLSPGPWKDNSQWPQLSCLENGSAERKHGGYGDGSVVAESFNSFRRLILRNHKQWYYYQTNHINTKPFSNKQNYRNHYNPIVIHWSVVICPDVFFAFRFLLSAVKLCFVRVLIESPWWFPYFACWLNHNLLLSDFRNYNFQSD
jgi:hypothetical protein